MTDAIDSTADEIGTEVAVVEHQPTTLFRTDDPMEVVEKAGKVADALKAVLVKQQLTKRIQGREHVLVEGWSTLGSMLGVVPVCVWSRKVPDTQREYGHREKVDQTWQVVKRKGSDWEARVEARTLDGRTIGAAEATCSRQEQTWETRDDYALRSMAQTRATSKALRGPLGFIVTLAGYQATPAEEMDGVAAEFDSATPTAPQLKELGRQIKMAKPSVDVLREMLKVASVQGVVESDLLDGLWSTKITKAQASVLLDMLKEGKLPTGQSDLPADDPPEAPAVGDDGDLPFDAVAHDA
jgi:hypothetical protein